MRAITLAASRLGLPGASRVARRHAAATAVLALATTSLAGGLLLADASPAAAQPTPACGAPTISGSTATVICSYTGAAQYWTVPDGVTGATFTLYGAEGGAGDGTPPGGRGAEVTGTLTVTPGAVLQVNVGQAGAENSGESFGGGGAGHGDSGGGGGLSSVISPAADGSYSLSDALLVAAGGGGTGIDGFDSDSSANSGIGGSSGSPGGAGGSLTGDCGETLGGGGGGGAGTPTAGGAGGAGGTAPPFSESCFWDAGSAGSAGTAGGGGAGGGGGGGGGVFGGGGGGGFAIDDGGFSGSGGGGGGSSFPASSTATVTVTDGVAAQSGAPNGEVIITYQVLSVATTSLPGGTAGTAYSASLAAANGTPPYTWSVTSGSLPAGLNLSSAGVISGVPTSGGTSDFTVQVSDSTTPTAMTATQTLSLTIDPATPQVTLSASPTTGNATVATPVTLTATVAGVADVAAPTGSVAFTVDGSPASCGAAGTVALTAGSASCALGDLSASSYSFTATYSGDSNYLTTAASLTGYPVNMLNQTITFGPAPASPQYGGSYTPAATATSGLPVTFSIDASSTAGACSLDSPTGVVSFTGTGTCTVDANQAGNPTYAAAPQLQQSFTIGTASPQVFLSVTPPSGATVASDVQLSVTVVGVAGGATPTGSVTFSVDGSPASCGSAGTVTVTSGQASCDIGMLAAGSHNFTASYSGDTDYGPATGGLFLYPVQLLSQTVTFTTSAPSPADFGGSYTPAATASSGLAVTLSIDASSAPGACMLSADGSTVEFTGLGMCIVDASQAGSSQYASAQAQQSFTIAPAATMTDLSVTGSALTATVTAVSPGGGTPSGTVTFMVDGTSVGTVDLNAAGVAALSYTSHGAETVAASYAGTTDYLPSAVSTATKNPVIKAVLTSKYPKSKYGWYRAPVTVSFTCTAGSAPLTSQCPGPVTLTRNGANQRVSKTIDGTDGGIATVTVVVNIDQSAPKVTLTGIKNKAAYDAPGPAKIGCRASETISGLAGPCKLTVKRSATAITWTATATSRAGIVTTVKGKATLRDFFVTRVPLRHGRFLLRVNRTYTIEAYLPGAKKAPRYVDPAPAGVRPHPVGPALTRIGHGLWVIRTAITARMARKYETWDIGILVRRTLHLIPITLKR